MTNCLLVLPLSPFDVQGILRCAVSKAETPDADGFRRGTGSDEIKAMMAFDRKD